MAAEAFDLVILLADADAERFFTAIIRRGIERQCLPPIKLKVVRDPLKDASVVRSADSTLRSYARTPMPRMIVLWDHHGSGRELDSPAVVEADVHKLVKRIGVPPDHILTLAVVPEFETLLGPAWDRVLNVLAEIGSSMRSNVAFNADDPKKSIEQAAQDSHVKLAPHVFNEMGNRVSIPQLKQTSIGKRLAEHLKDWFPVSPTT